MLIPENLSIKAAIKAILFASVQPVEAPKLAALFEMELGEITDILEEIKTEFDGRDSGFRLVQTDMRYQFSTKREYGEIVASYLEQRRAAFLSNAALEALAIIAYNQPTTKTFVSQIRGVSSAEVVESLAEKGLIEENGRLDLPGRPMSYITTDKFLTVFGLEDLSGLPKTDLIAGDGQDEEEEYEQTSILDEPVTEDGNS